MKKLALVILMLPLFATAQYVQNKNPTEFTKPVKFDTTVNIGADINLAKFNLLGTSIQEYSNTVADSMICANFGLLPFLPSIGLTSLKLLNIHDGSQLIDMVAQHVEGVGDNLMGLNGYGTYTRVGFPSQINYSLRAQTQYGFYTKAIGHINGNISETKYVQTDTAIGMYTTNGLFYFQATTGNVGIGTIIPTATLDVRGDLHQIFNSFSGDVYSIDVNDNAGGISLAANSTSSDQYSYINDISGTVNIHVNSISTGAYTDYTQNKTGITIGTNGNGTQLHLDTSGFSGFGLLSPTSILQVHGAFTLSDSTNTVANTAKLYIDNAGAYHIDATNASAVFVDGLGFYDSDLSAAAAVPPVPVGALYKNTISGAIVYRQN